MSATTFEHAGYPSVSVIIPTRNRPQSVLGAIATAAEQTLRDLEIIVVIDGPDDATLTAVRGLKDPRIRILPLATNRGAAAARNEGIAVARAEWIALLDDDDQWQPEKLATQVERAQGLASRFPVIACRMLCRTSGGASIAPRRLPHPGEPVSEYLFSRRSLFRDEGGVQSSMLLARRELFLRVAFREDLRRHHEADWILRAAQVPGFQFEVVDRILGVWRTDAPQRRISETGGWEYSLEWLRGNRLNVTRRAYAAFVLVAVAALAARERAWPALSTLLREAREHGDPLPIHYVLFVAMWLIPRRARGAIRFALLNRSERVPRVLVVGQTPPPYHGQAVAIQNTLKGSFTGVEMFHVRLHFSKAIDEIGRVSIRKIFHVPAVLLRIAASRIRHGLDVLYYVPAGPDRVAIWRDFLILIPARPLFRSTVFHFHASGLSTAYSGLTAVERLLFRVAYFNPAAAIRLAPETEPDGTFVRARSEFIIPNGIEDQHTRVSIEGRRGRVVPHLLWVSNLIESKGIFVLLDACAILNARKVPFELDIVGGQSSQAVDDRIAVRINELGANRVRLCGPLSGDAKWNAFANADVFCLPTYYEREGMPLVVLEAMQFDLPVVATRWRGIPAMVEDGRTGFLVPVRDAVATADSIEKLLKDVDLRRAFGSAGRAAFERDFTLRAFTARLEQALLSVTS